MYFVSQEERGNLTGVGVVHSYRNATILLKRFLVLEILAVICSKKERFLLLYFLRLDDLGSRQYIHTESRLSETDTAVKLKQFKSRVLVQEFLFFLWSFS
jgi:hypothetical protein